MPRLNWKTIVSNVAEAREQLEQIEKLAKSAKKPREGQLQIMLEHAYHHLNFAWNTRHTSSKRYSSLSDEEFNEWSKFPKRIEEWRVKMKAPRKIRSKK